MTGQNERSGIAGKAIDIVENAGSKVEDVVEGVIGEDHIVVRKTKKVWQYFLLYPAVFGVLLGAIPTGIDLYKSFKYGIAVSDVAHAEEQKNLWIKNLHCVQGLTYHAVKTEDGSTVQIGACQNGDVLIELIPEGGATQVAEWVSLDRTKAAGAVGSLLVSKAFAAASGGAAAVVASGEKVETICTSLNAQKQTIERIIKRNGVCMREVNNMITRKSIKREEVPCDTKCTPTKG
jgi:cupin superfamily acireductone dioxygenase involved in methionine salvage